MACKRELISVPYHDSIRVGDARLTYTPLLCGRSIVSVLSN